MKDITKRGVPGVKPQTMLSELTAEWCMPEKELLYHTPWKDGAEVEVDDGDDDDGGGGGGGDDDFCEIKADSETEVGGRGGLITEEIVTPVAAVQGVSSVL